MTISLTGFMGCGKSSVGRKLSELLCCPFMDLDAEIEARCGCTVAEIFAERGEAEFRRLEVQTLRCLLEDVRCLGRSLRSPHHCASLVVPPLPCRGWHGPRPPHTLSATANFASPDSNPITNTEQDSTSPAEKNSALILALGGGAVMTKECEEMVHEQTVCVYLKASVDELVSRLSGESAGRPLLNTTDLRPRILDLMRQRASTYERVAHLVINTDGKTIEQVASEIAKKIHSI